MKLGISLPLVDIQGDPIVVRDFAQAAEGLGYNGLSAPDHVLGVNVASRPDWGARNTSKDFFHDPFVLFGYLSACTRAIGVSTQVMILPQRQTALVAKQAAAVDVLSGGRLRLGVAVGWNPVEYEALGEEFRTRGKRIDEQIEVMRALWTKELVTIGASRHRITAAGINPLPIQRPIPIWLGGHSEAAMRRAARVADGWMWSGNIRPDAEGRKTVEAVHALVASSGRNPASFGIEGRVPLARLSPDQWAADVAGWRAMAGVTHVCVDTMRLGLTKAAQHIETLRRFAEVAGPLR